jgi:hypothetical protein
MTDDSGFMRDKYGAMEDRFEIAIPYIRLYFGAKK